MVTSTNAGIGYNLATYGTTMTSGNNEIAATQNATSQVGTNQFGINLRANTTPHIGADTSGPGTAHPTTNYNNVNRFTFKSGDTVAQATGAQDYRKFTTSYIVNVSKDQAPGVYSTTLTYVCLANF